MKTTKKLLKELENKSAFALAWSVMWRWFVIVLGFYLAIFGIAMVYGIFSVLVAL